MLARSVIEELRSTATQSHQVVGSGRKGEGPTGAGKSAYIAIRSRAACWSLHGLGDIRGSSRCPFLAMPMRCSNCKTENPAGKKFCGDCGAALANLCPKCAADNPAGKRFCGECGTALGAPAAATSARKSNDLSIRVADTPASDSLEGERKTVTALFADIKGSMELMEDIDPEEARAIVDPALKLMIDAVHRYDGYIVQSTGDGIFALFGAPVAHEDHPQRALYAGFRMQEELKRYSDHIRSEGRLPSSGGSEHRRSRSTFDQDR